MPTENVEVRLKYVVDTTQASRALADLQKQNDRMGKLNGNGGGAGGGGGGGGPPPSGGSPSRNPASDVNAFAPLWKIGFYGAIVVKSFEGISKASEAYIAAQKRGASQILSAAGALFDTVTFGLASSVGNAIYDTYYAKSKSNAISTRQATTRDMAMVGPRSEAISQQRALRLENFTYQSQSSGSISNSIARADEARLVARMSPEERAVYDAQDAHRQALAGQETAKGNVNELAAQEAAARDKLAKSTGWRDASVKELASRPIARTQNELILSQVTGQNSTSNGYRNDYQTIELQDRNRSANTQVLADESALLDILQKKKAALAQLDEKSVEALKRKNEISRVELDLLKQREQSAKSNQESFGMMSASDKSSLLDTLRQVKTQGYGSLTADQRSEFHGNPLTADLAREEAFKEGKNDPVLKEILALLNQGSFEHLNKQRIDMEAKINVDVNLDEATIRKAASDAFADIVPDIRKLIDEVMATKMRLQLNQPKQIN